MMMNREYTFRILPLMIPEKAEKLIIREIIQGPRKPTFHKQHFWEYFEI